MDNQDFNMEELQALIAATYAGGNSWAARSARARLQRRDDEGKFAEMFGSMRLIMLLNGQPVAGYGKYVGASTRPGPGGSDNMGWVYIDPDKNFPNGKFVRVPVDKINLFDGEEGGVAILGEDFLREKGIDPKNPNYEAGMLNFDDLESQDYPPGFVPHPSVGGAFISEDGDVTIEPDGNGGWDIIDNLDREAPVRNAADLPSALEQVYEIDKTRSNYEPAEGEAPATAEAPEAPVAEIPETVLPDPAGMTNADLLAEGRKLYGPDGRTLPLADPERAQKVMDEVDARAELEPDGYEGDWFEDNADFVRDPSKSEAPVAQLPSAETELDEQVAEIQARSIADEGATYSILGADAPTEGYMVSHEAIVDPVDKDVFEGEGGKQALFDFVMKAKELGFFQNEKEFVGVWLDTETNKYYLDVSEHVMDLEEAKRLGAERNQIAIWDIVNGEAINVGGTGERKETDSGAEPDGQDGSRDSGDNRQPVGESAGEVVEQAEADKENSEQVAEETADPATVDAAEEVVEAATPVVEQAAVKPPRAPREPSIGAFTGRMLELLNGVTDPKQVQDIINGEEITYIDFETSGFSAVPGDGALNRPLQMGIVKVRNGEVVDRKNLWMNPEMELSEWSRNNLKDGDGNPLTDEWLASQPSMKEALEEAVEFIGPNAILGGQNVQFDLEVLTRSLREQGIDFSFDGTIDSRDLGKKTLPTWTPENPVGPNKTDADGNVSASNSLGDLISFLQGEGYDVELDNWHSADADAQATHELVQALLQRAVDNNVDMGVLTDKAQRDAESASEWAEYNAQYEQYVADLSNYFDQTNDPNKEERLALAQPLSPEGFGLVNMGGGDSQPPATPEATPAGEPEDFDALSKEILEKYPVNPANAIRMIQRAASDTRDPQEIADEIDALIARLQNSNGPRGTVKEFIKQLRAYKDANSPAEREDRLAREGRGAQEAQEQQAEAERLRAEEAQRYQQWLDNGGQEKLAEFDQKVKDLVRNARETGVDPEDFDPQALQDEFNALVTVDGVFSPTAANQYGPYGRALRKNTAISEDVQFKVNQAISAYKRRQQEEEQIPLRLNSLLDEYDTDGSARELFDNGASYEEIYQNLLNQNSGWAEGYDENYWARDDLRRVGVPAHVGEMSALRAAVELRDRTQFTVSDAPDLTEALSGARQSGNANDVVRVSDRKDAVDAVVESIEDNTPIVDETPETTEVVTETVTEIGPKPQLTMDSYVLNPEPTTSDLRRAKDLDGVSQTALQDAITDAINNGEKTLSIGGKKYPVHVAIQALGSRGVDTDLFVAGLLDAKSGSTVSTDAINDYRNSDPDVLREEPENAQPATLDEALTQFMDETPQQELMSIYMDAFMNNQDTVSIALENFGEPNAYGVNVVEVPLRDFRQRLSDRGIDMDSVEAGSPSNEKTKEDIAKSVGSSVEELTTSYRTDWKDVINLNSPEYNTIRFYDEDGIMFEFARDENGKWYRTDKEKNKRGNFGYKNDAMINFIEKNADQEETIEITNERADYDENGDIIDESRNVFAFGTGLEKDELSPEERAIINSWRHVTYGDLKAMRALQNQGYVFNVLDKMNELFPDAERRGEDELVTESHEWEDPITKDKYRFEVVVTKTPNEYYYTYVRRINLTTGEAWSSRPGRMNQSALGLVRTYRREIAKFHRSFFKAGGPRAWFESNATKRRMKKDVKDENGNWVHAKDLQLDRNTSAMILNLLGAKPGSVQEITKAEDKLMRDILNNIAKYRHRDHSLVLAAARIAKRHKRQIDPVYMFEVADAYDRHISNQRNLDAFGEHISFDQRTPLEEGDTVEWVHSKAGVKRRGVVKKRLGFVNANGGYQYGDYILVQWDNGKFQVTAARNNRLIETAEGTDGSERVQYKPEVSDPRADYGTELGVNRRDVIPNPIVVPKPQYGPVRYDAARNDNSEMVLEDGTIVPERMVGSEPTTTLKKPQDITRGDYISVLGDQLQPVQAVALEGPERSEYDNGYVVTVATRQSDGSYAIQEIHYSGEPNALAEVSNYPEVNPSNGVTAAQMNEILELLGSKELPDRPDWGLLNYYLGVLDGKDMSGVYSPEEVSEIVQELRAMPDRETAPIQEAADFARAMSEVAEQDNDGDASQSFEALADAADIVASQDTSAGGPTGSMVTPEELYKEFGDNKPLLDMLTKIGNADIQRVRGALSAMFNSGEIDYIEYRWADRYLGRATSSLKAMAQYFGNFNQREFLDRFNDLSPQEQAEMRYSFQDTFRLLNNLPNFFSDEMLDNMVRRNISGALDLVNFLTEIKENPIQFTDNRVANSYYEALDASYGDASSPRREKARALKEAYEAGYTATEIQGSSSGSPTDSQNEVMFVTLSDGSRAVLKYLTANGLSEAINELVTGRTHEELGLATPASTVVLGPNGEEALLIEFVPSDAIQAATYGADASEIYDMEDAPMLAVMDLVAGNADRHDENWFYDPEEGRIYPIDHGLAYNQTGIDSRFALERWIDYIANAGAWYPGFGDIIHDFVMENRRDKVDTSLLTQMESRISSLRDMYASMGMLEMYEQLIAGLGVLLGISRTGR